MKLFKDGTLFIPPRALQFFSFVLGGSGGPRARPCFISEGWYFSDPDPEEGMCKNKNKTTKSFQTNLEFPFLNKRLWTGGLQTVLREMMGPLQTMYLESTLDGCAQTSFERRHPNSCRISKSARDSGQNVFSKEEDIRARAHLTRRFRCADHTPLSIMAYRRKRC